MGGVLSRRLIRIAAEVYYLLLAAAGITSNTE